MSIQAKCPFCGAEFRRPDGLLGKLEKCPECHKVVQMPSVVLAPGQQQTDILSPAPVRQEPSPQKQRAEPQQPPVQKLTFRKPVARPAPIPTAPVEESGNPYQSPAATGSVPRHRRSSHGGRYVLLRGWLILVIVTNLIGMIHSLYRIFMAIQMSVPMPNWVIPVILFACLADVLCVVCAVAILRWKIWGVYGYVLLKTIVAAAGLVFGDMIGITGLVSVAVLFSLLHVGGRDKAWGRLD
jgi:hypothetical protein